MKRNLYATAPKGAQTPKPARVRKAPKAKRTVHVYVPATPMSLDASYTPRNVTHEDRATLRGAIYFVRLTPGAQFTLARFARGEGFHAHGAKVTPCEVWTCAKADIDTLYIVRPTDCLGAVQSGNPLARPYL